MVLIRDVYSRVNTCYTGNCIAVDSVSLHYTHMQALAITINPHINRSIINLKPIAQTLWAPSSNSCVHELQLATCVNLLI